MQRHLKTEQKFNGKGPFGTKDQRNDAQMPGPTGPKTKQRAKAMRRPPFNQTLADIQRLLDRLAQSPMAKRQAGDLIEEKE